MPREAGCELLAALPDGGLLLDGQGRVLAINAAASIMLGPAVPDVGDKPLSRQLRECGGDAWVSLAERIEAGAKSETLIKLPDGRSILAGVRSVRSGPAAESRLLVTLRDIAVIDHERRQAASPGERTGFRFVSERKLRPDLVRQRQISPGLDRLLTLAERAVVQGARVLLLGESGVGKTELARHLHDYICEDRAPFVHVNCGSIPETLFEAELFGHERGAFTGALQTGRKGYIEAADGGTLFLDEVGEVPLQMQSRLLKFLESGTIQRVGGAEERGVRVRVISATNRDLDRMVADGRFRRDLFYRLAVVPLRVRSLRESPELIAEIADYFMTILNQRRPKPLQLTPACRERLQGYAYPGNIRELFNVLQQLSVVADETAGEEHLPESFRQPESNVAHSPLDARRADLKEQVRAYERGIIERAIAAHGSKRKAAEALGVDIGTIVRKTQTRH